MNKISIDLCGCCNQPCDGNGIYGQALQSNLCESYHAMCENFGRKQYKSFSSLKRIIAEFVRSSMDKSDEVLDLFKDSFKKLNKICSFYHDSSNWIVHWRSWYKNRNLLSSKSVLHKEIRSFSKSVKDFAAPVSTVDVGANPVVHISCTIVDELAKRDERKKSIVIYNLPEGKDRGG